MGNQSEYRRISIACDILDIEARMETARSYHYDVYFLGGRI